MVAIWVAYRGSAHGSFVFGNWEGAAELYAVAWRIHYISSSGSRRLGSARDASKTIWSYCQRRSKKRRARRSPSPSGNASRSISPRVRFPSMAPSSRSSKKSTVQMRSVNVWDRLISTATLPGGRRSRTHTVHGTCNGDVVAPRSPANVIGWLSSALSSRYAMKLCDTIVPRKSSTAACCSPEGSAASRKACGLPANIPHWAR